ncbi:MAG: aminoacyl-tRNA hydrolase [Verrucomicrobia bacterium]|nr:aminoacyl-tRNA hydrolase [Verrucomicrobiota bacterium]MBU6445950.1 aminoacyl-tRNA hydrolase [Verrucomicrobiota bacterium]MDE3046998.1 aminoacyl-tRNA hydrolase [Verrucomicrobiota bacterium]
MGALIVGLGNPGKTYKGTRHNIGFEAVDFLAKRHRLEWKKQLKWKGMVAEGKIGDDSAILLKPLTYMNLSGESVVLMMHYFHIDLSRLLILVDDVALPLGQLRIRINSGSGGHNGLKSIEESLQTNRYPRLRIGVGDRDDGDLTDHVLGKFSKTEETLLPSVLERAVQAVEIWLDEGLTSAMNFANKGSSTPSIGEENEET